VGLYREAGRKFQVRLEHTPIEVKHFVAAAAVKMVVVLEAGPFVARGLAWQFHGAEAMLLHKIIEGPIHGGNSKIGYGGAGKRPDFAGTEGAGYGVKYGFYRRALSGVALPGHVPSMRAGPDFVNTEPLSRFPHCGEEEGLIE
jgi:hypothetical protein